MEEIWKDINSFEGFYQISNLGRIKSLERIVKWKNSFRKIKERILKVLPDRYGYYHIFLCMHSVQKMFLVHRLVAIAFIPNPNNFPQVNHKDGNKENNIVLNLEWLTKSMDHKHAYKLGLRKSPMTKLTKRKASNIRKIYNKGGITQTKLAKQYKVSSTVISLIVRFKIWNNI